MTERPKGQGSSSSGGSNGGSQYQASEDAAEIFAKILQQVQTRTERSVSSEAQTAVEVQNRLKAALLKPQISKPVPEKERWQLPDLNETAKRT